MVASPSDSRKKFRFTPPLRTRDVCLDYRAGRVSFYPYWYRRRVQRAGGQLCGEKRRNVLFASPRVRKGRH